MMRIGSNNLGKKALVECQRCFQTSNGLNFWYTSRNNLVQYESHVSAISPSIFPLYPPEPKLDSKAAVYDIRDDVLFERNGKAGIIQLNRPRLLNAFNLRMANKISFQLKKWKREASFVIIKGNGDKAFCAGGDVVAAFEAAKNQDPSAHDFFRGIYEIAHLVDTLKMPYIAFIDGVTMGGGVGLSLQGTHRIASEKTVFSMPEVVIGWFTDVGASHFLPRLPNWLGTFYGLTGHKLYGLDVVKGGIASHYCERKKIPSLEKDLLNIYDTNLITEMLNDYTDQYLNNGNHEFSLARHLEKIQNCFSKNTVEEIIEALRMEGSAWSLKQIKIMNKMSPTSLKVIHRMILEGQKLNLQECLNMEMGICYRFLEERGDFYEGVRAVLVDKDFKPKWYPSSLDKISKDKLNHYFTPLSPTFRLKF